MSNSAVILLGSNEGQLFQNLEQAKLLLCQKTGKIIQSTCVYETEPWGKTDQPFFLNQVVVLSTQMSPDELMNELLFIEEQMGRRRTVKWEQRLIDLDILFYNDAVINKEKLTIPHPHLHERRFTLVPLAEILPGMFHPVLNKNIKTLLSELSDPAMVRISSVEIHNKL